MKAKEGFSRSDLIMVVVCVVVLCLALSAIGTTGRERAKMIICQSNLKQLGRAMEIYMADNSGIFPNSYTWLYRRGGNYNCRWHHEAGNLAHRPHYAGELWGYLDNSNIILCPTFNRLASGGLGQSHYQHNPSIPMIPQYTYSMNGYLGPTTGGQITRGRFAVVNQLGLIEQSPSMVFSFTEENIMWNIQNRSAITATLGNNNIVSRIARTSNREKDGKKYLPDMYNGAFATYHMAPSGDIELMTIDGVNYATQQGANYPEWGLCRGYGNAVYLDMHVEAMPYWVDTHEYCWPLGDKVPRPPDWWPNLIQ